MEFEAAVEVAVGPAFLGTEVGGFPVPSGGYNAPALEERGRRIIGRAEGGIVRLATRRRRMLSPFKPIKSRGNRRSLDGPQDKIIR
jgi:hypothetical protein